MRNSLTSVCLIALFLISRSEVRSAPMPQTSDPGWSQVRSLGKMWQWHTLLGVSPDGTKLLLGGYSNILAVYDLTTGKVAQVLRTRESVQDAAFSPDGKILAVAEWRDGLKLRDATTLEVIDTLTGSGKLSSSQVRFSRDGSRLVCYSWWGNGKQFWSYDLQTKKEIGWPAGTNADTATVYMREGLRGWGNHLFSVEKHRNNGYYTGYKVWVTDAESGQTGPKIELGKKDYFQFDLSPDGGSAIVMQPGEDPRIVDLQTGQTVRTLDGHRRWVTCAAFSPDGKLIATASGTTEDGFARVYTDKYSPHDAPSEIIIRETATGKVIATLQDKDKHDYAYVGFSPDGKYLFAMTREKGLLLWGKLPAIPANADPLPNYDNDIRPNPVAAAPLPPTPKGRDTDRFDRLIKELAASDRTREQKLEALFLVTLGRLPTRLEESLALKGRENALDSIAGLTMVLETLIASPEFREHAAALQSRVRKGQ